jgi:CelD/BcsL family acetyltransferase involved in cellulose biosynthesis
MSYTASAETLDWFKQYWLEHPNDFKWEPIFILPPWLQVWKKNFAPNTETAVIAIHNSDKIVGFAPLQFNNNTAAIIGSPNVCDFEDFIVVPGEEHGFVQALVDFLKQKKINILEPGIIRPDSRVALKLSPIASGFGAKSICEPDEVSIEKELPATFDDYLQSLDAKQRHEVRRKLRRLEEAGNISYQFITDPSSVPEFLEIFVKMFVESRTEKATFLTSQTEGFFRDIAMVMSEHGFLRSSILQLDKRPMASVFAFDYRDTVYLYNSGFDPDRSYLSVGILSKALLIKDSIERGKKKFDFLKGGEQYKYHLGGAEVQLQKCKIILK